MRCHVKTRRLPEFALTVLLAAVFAGCQQEPVPPSDPTTAVTGTVTLDGKPLEEGRIVFIETDSEPRREYLAMIVNGLFEATAPPGTRRVEIRAYEKPETPTAEAGTYPQILPARYNEDSELSAELKADGPNELKFELTSDE